MKKYNYFTVEKHIYTGYTQKDQIHKRLSDVDYLAISDNYNGSIWYNDGEDYAQIVEVWNAYYSKHDNAYMSKREAERLGLNLEDLEYIDNKVIICVRKNEE